MMSDYSKRIKIFFIFFSPSSHLWKHLLQSLPHQFMMLTIPALQTSTLSIQVSLNTILSNIDGLCFIYVAAMCNVDFYLLKINSDCVIA